MISIVICTRNRAASLRQALQSVAQLRPAEGVAWELVVVDNNSTDDTHAVVQEAARANPFPVRYVLERQKGLSFARNAGLRSSHGDIIAFTDDDVIVDPTWLQQIHEQFSRYPDTGMFFGRTKLMHDGFAELSTKDKDGEEVYRFPCDPSSPGPGNNMILRRATVDRVGDFDVELGAGTKLGSSEDTDYTYRVLRSGGCVRYSPSIVLFHNHDRLTAEQVRALLFVYGRGRGAFYAKHMFAGDWWAAKLLYWELKWFVGSVLRGKRTRSAIIHLCGVAIGIAMKAAFVLRDIASGRRVPALDAGQQSM